MKKTKKDLADFMIITMSQAIIAGYSYQDGIKMFSALAAIMTAIDKNPKLTDALGVELVLSYLYNRVI